MSRSLVLQRAGLNDLKTKQNKKIKKSHFHWAHRTTNRLTISISGRRRQQEAQNVSRKHGRPGKGETGTAVLSCKVEGVAPGLVSLPDSLGGRSSREGPRERRPGVGLRPTPQPLPGDAPSRGGRTTLLKQSGGTPCSVA